MVLQEYTIISLRIGGWNIFQVRETQVKERLLIDIWEEVIQLKTLKGYLACLRSSSGNQTSSKSNLTTIFSHHLLAKLFLGPPTVGYSQNIIQINWGFRPNDPYIVVGYHHKIRLQLFIFLLCWVYNCACAQLTLSLLLPSSHIHEYQSLTCAMHGKILHTCIMYDETNSISFFY